MTKHVFQIGFNRAGTTALYHFFRANGVAAIHNDEGNIARNFMKRKAAGEDPFQDYPGVIFFSDMGTSFGGQVIDTFKEFRYIYRFYPDAYFILNVRNMQRWLLSRCNSGHLLERHMQVLGYGSVEETLRQWSLDWTRHLQDVKAFFADKPSQLLVFDIEQDAPLKIVEFLRPDFDLDASLYSRSNETTRGHKRFWALPNYLVLPK
jgi:hypothetical protein